LAILLLLDTLTGGDGPSSGMVWMGLLLQLSSSFGGVGGAATRKCDGISGNGSVAESGDEVEESLECRFSGGVDEGDELCVEGGGDGLDAAATA